MEAGLERGGEELEVGPEEGAPPSPAPLFRALDAEHGRILAAGSRAAPGLALLEGLSERLRQGPHLLLGQCLLEDCRDDKARSLTHRLVLAAALLRSRLAGAEALQRLAAANLVGTGPVPPELDSAEGERAWNEALLLSLTFHELVHRGPWSPMRLHEAAVWVLEGKAADLSRDTLKTFLNEFSLYPPGSVVRLSNGAQARVVQAHAGYPARPTVSPLPRGPLLDLRRQPLLRIEPDARVPRRRRFRRRLGLIARLREWLGSRAPASED